MQQWIDGLTELLGIHQEAGARARQSETFGSTMSWEELGDAEDLELKLAGARDVDGVLKRHPWLQVAERIAQQQGFFHWELDFATVFARGGFDLQVGNPPWVRPRSDVDALLAEGDPWWQLANKPSESARAAKRQATLVLPGIRELVVDGTAEVAVTAAFVGALTEFPALTGLQPDLYRCFMVQTWRHQSPRGTVGLIHPETHFTDEKAGLLRSETYPRLRRHWQFINELTLFEVHHLVAYGVHIYAVPQSSVHFLQAASLYHPDTVGRSLDHDGSGPEPGLKDPDGRWDLRPHASRIITVDEDELQTWHAVLESSDVPLGRTRMLYTVNRSVARVLEKLSRAPRIGSLGLEFSSGWHEKNDRTKGYFESGWGRPESWDDVILQGPHLHVATPFYKSPNPTMLHNQDWSAVDLETLPADAIPVTSYKPAGDEYAYDADYTHWGPDDDPTPARDHYRIAWRAMAANTGERTLITALIPPGTAHINGVFSVGDLANSAGTLADVAASTATLLVDVLVRAAPKSGIYQGVFDRLPVFASSPLTSSIRLRILRLSCLTEAFADLWQQAFDPAFRFDDWTSLQGDLIEAGLGAVGPSWSAATPLRLAVERRQALLELDALVALALGVPVDELCAVYRTQFPVLAGYDRNVYLYDANGRLVPTEVRQAWLKKGEELTAEERTAVHPAGTVYTYELPFRFLDREADMRAAYAEFERRLAERGTA